MKRLYRSGLLITLAEEDDDLINFWKKMSVLDAIHGIAKAWSKAKPITLVRSWRKILPNVEIDLSDCEEIEASDTSEICRIMENLKCFENVDRENIEEWFDRDSNDLDFQCMSDADIVSNVTQTEEGESDSENTSEEDTDNYISLQTALTSVETSLDLVDQRGFEYNDKIALRKIRNEIRKLLRDSQKQTRITDFVNK